MSTPEFTIETAVPPIHHRGVQKSALRLRIEELKTGQVLRYRPTDAAPGPHQIHAAVSVIAKSNKITLTLRKVDGGVDIYRTA
jgi:hypothetical protein